MARVCRSVARGWTLESFDCSRNINPPRILQFAGLATLQAGIEPGGVCPVVFVVIDGVRVHSFHPDGATIDLICEGLDTGRVDCLNGGCIPSATYGTPGVFANLAACESGCAQNSNCTGECVSAEELAALQQAANNLRSRLCG